MTFNDIATQFYNAGANYSTANPTIRHQAFLSRCCFHDSL